MRVLGIRRAQSGGHKDCLIKAGQARSVNDYILYASMIANRGTFNGVTVLKEETVDLQLTERLDISSFQHGHKTRFRVGVWNRL